MLPLSFIYTSVAVLGMVSVVVIATPSDDDAADLLPYGLQSSTHPPCGSGESWSENAERCCRVCPAGQGAIGVCSADEVPVDEGEVVDPSLSRRVTSNKTNSGGGAGGLGVGGSSGNAGGKLGLDPIIVNGCQLCVEGLNFSPNASPDEPCRTCSACPKNSTPLLPCNSTHDTVCACEAGVFYLSSKTGQCELCDLCPAGWGARTPCGATSGGSGSGNTECYKCQNGTYSDVLDGRAPCSACTRCQEGQRLLQECTATQDTICLDKYMDIPPRYRFNNNNRQRLHDLDLGGHLEVDDAGRRQSSPAVHDDDDGIDVIPLYCAALGSVVVGLLAYVAFVHYRRMRDKRMSREPHEDVEYSKASGADSGVFSDPDHHHHLNHLHHLHHQQQHHNHQQQKYHTGSMTGSTRLRDLSASKKKELEMTYLAGLRGPADWKGLARELGYNSGKIASFESRGGGQHDVGAPYRQVMHDWSRQEGATVAAFLRALRNTGRHDVVKFLHSECNEQLQPLTGTLPHHMV